MNESDVIIESKTKSSATYSYPYMGLVKTKGNVRIELGAAGFHNNKRLVNVYMYLYRTVTSDKGKIVGKQYIEWKSEAGKKKRRGWKAYKTQHTFEGLAYRIRNIGELVPGTTNQYRFVTKEHLTGGGMGTVGKDQKTCSIPIPFQNENIPEEFLPINFSNVEFAEIRGRTRGTGTCGARVMVGNKWLMPFWLNECGDWKRNVGVFD